jgi:hypothetical protein
MNKMCPIDTRALISALSTSDVEHVYALLHACKDELPSARDAGVREAFDMVGDPVDNVRLPVDLSSSVLRELAKAQQDAGEDCVSAGPRTYPGTNVELARCVAGPILFGTLFSLFVLLRFESLSSCNQCVKCPIFLYCLVCSSYRTIDYSCCVLRVFVPPKT